VHVRRRADPDNVQLGKRDEFRPIFDWHRIGQVFAAEFFCTLVGGIRDCDDFDFGIFLERGQMTGSDDIARSNNSDPQLVIILMHWLYAISLVLNRVALARIMFDRVASRAFNTLNQVVEPASQ
jgi:hypothetical protein